MSSVKTDIWMPIYWPDWVRDTAQLSLQEQGAYLMLTKEYWNKRSELCDDKTRLYRSCGAQSRSEKESVNFILDTYFLHENGMYISKRIDEELARAAENKVTQQKRTEAARAAKAKKTKTVTKSVTSSPSPTPTPLKKKGIDKVKVSIPKEWQNDFNDLLDMIKKIKAPMTEVAKKLLINKLHKLEKDSNDPMLVMQQSILNNWKDVYAIKDDNSSKSGGRSQTEINKTRYWAMVKRSKDGGLLDSKEQNWKYCYENNKELPEI